MADFVGQFQSTMKGLDSKFASNSILSQFETQTKVPKSYAILALGVFYFVLIFINVGGIGQLLSNIAGFVVPAYLSLEALATSSTKDDTQLLTYWVVFAFLNVIEFWTSALLYWIPFYWFLKTFFVLWLSLPQFNGSALLYQGMLKPFADKYLGKSEKLVEKVEEAAKAASTGVDKH